MELKYPSGETKVWNFNRRDQLESMMTKISSLSHATIGYGRPLAGGKRTRDGFLEKQGLWLCTFTCPLN